MVTHSWMDSTHCTFPMICGMPRSSSWLGRYGLVKLEALKSGKEAPSWL
jgi:hypothetical protein